MRFLTAMIVAALLGTGAAQSATGDEQAVRQADQTLLQAMTKSDGAAARALMDNGFTWTDADGKTQTKSAVLKSLPAPADQSNAEVTTRIYGDVGLITSKRDNVYTMRVWVKNGRRWQALVYHEVKVTLPPASPSAAAPAQPARDCKNPCRTLPYKPRNAAERGVIESWQALEIAVTAGKGDDWAPHVADEFIVVGNARVQTKPERQAAVSRAGSAPAPLVSAQMFDFGDAIVMTCLHQPHAGKPIRVSRVWVKRATMWQMAISYQTTIQAAEAKHAH